MDISFFDIHLGLRLGRLEMQKIHFYRVFIFTWGGKRGQTKRDEKGQSYPEDISKRQRQQKVFKQIKTLFSRTYFLLDHIKRLGYSLL